MQAFQNLGVISRGQDLLISKVEISAQNLFHMVHFEQNKKFGCFIEKNSGTPFKDWTPKPQKQSFFSRKLRFSGIFFNGAIKFFLHKMYMGTSKTMSKRFWANISTFEIRRSCPLDMTPRFQKPAYPFQIWSKLQNCPTFTVRFKP